MWTLQRKQAEENLLVAVDSANVNDFASLERLVAQLAAMETMDYPATVEENGTPTKHNLNDKVGAGQTAVLMANSRLTQLKATKKEHVRIQESLETAMKYDNMEDVERAVSEADEIGFNHPSIEQGRALLAVMNERQKVGAFFYHDDMASLDLLFLLFCSFHFSSLSMYSSTLYGTNSHSMIIFIRN